MLHLSGPETYLWSVVQVAPASGKPSVQKKFAEQPNLEAAFLQNGAVVKIFVALRQIGGVLQAYVLVGAEGPLCRQKKSLESACTALGGDATQHNHLRAGRQRRVGQVNRVLLGKKKGAIATSKGQQQGAEQMVRHGR